MHVSKPSLQPRAVCASALPSIQAQPKTQRSRQDQTQCRDLKVCRSTCYTSRRAYSHEIVTRRSRGTVRAAFVERCRNSIHISNQSTPANKVRCISAGVTARATYTWRCDQVTCFIWVLEPPFSAVNCPRAASCRIWCTAGGPTAVITTWTNELPVRHGARRTDICVTVGVFRATVCPPIVPAIIVTILLRILKEAVVTLSLDATTLLVVFLAAYKVARFRSECPALA